MYERKIRPYIQEDFFKGKVLLIIGSRQVGKTTLVKEILSKLPTDKKVRMLNLDNSSDQTLLAQGDFETLNRIFVKDDFIFIDEAQRLPNIGIILKLLIDNYGSSKQIIATGSSSLNLLDSTSEPLTGRKFTYNLYPLSIQEIYADELLLKTNLESNLLYGFYPDVVTQKSNEDKIRILRELSTSYLYKDILEFQNIRNPEVLAKLLQLLALQIGSEVSYSELASKLGVDYKTVERYIDLLEKSFVIFRLSAYASNKRREISKNKKIYFYDLGIRNTIIDNFNPMNLRTDMGPLWENFLVAERLKYRSYNKIYAKQYFWRTYDDSEIDLVEDHGGKLFGYEFKLSKNKGKIPESWQKYEGSSYEVINRDKLLDFVY